MGAYLGAGSVKSPSAVYVGAGGVKTVSGIYIGQGGSVKLVWPEFIYDTGTFGALGGGMTFRSVDKYYPCVSSESSYIRIYGSASSYTSYTNGLVGAYCNSAISMSPYKKLTMTWTSPTHGTTSNTQNILCIGGCTGGVSFASNNNFSTLSISGTDYRTSDIYLCNYDTSSTYTLSLDVSSISSSLYVYIGFNRNNNNGAAANVEVRISKIELSA